MTAGSWVAADLVARPCPLCGTAVRPRVHHVPPWTYRLHIRCSCGVAFARELAGTDWRSEAQEVIRCVWDRRAPAA